MKIKREDTIIEQTMTDGTLELYADRCIAILSTLNLAEKLKVITSLEKGLRITLKDYGYKIIEAEVD